LDMSRADIDKLFTNCGMFGTSPILTSNKLFSYIVSVMLSRIETFRPSGNVSSCA
jgi:hypothetical protein